ncbi:MAG: FtsW/RodA/SpoVE family cell cycle protein [Clostridiales bacterium]|nr:FtsW/RodA/SpoVE family cell cycle protein [Clostridiales bacterium]
MAKGEKEGFGREKAAGMKSVRREYRSFDFMLFASVAALSVLGIILIGSATSVDARGATAEFKSQIMWVSTGIVIMLAAAFVDYRFVCRFFIAYYVINLLLLVIVITVDFKLPAGTPARSIYLGPAATAPFSIQPSEFNKLFMLIFLAKFIDRFREKINKIWMLAAVLALTAVPAVLIVRQPSLSAGMVTAVIAGVMLMAAKIRYRYIAAAVVLVLPLALILLYDVSSARVINGDDGITVTYPEDSYAPVLIDKVLIPYHISRIKTFLEPVEGSDEYYQNQKAMQAIRSGRLSGNGLFGGDVVVPEAANDFIFTTLAQDFGFVGCVATLSAALFVVVRCMMIAKRADIFYGKLIAAGTGGIIAFQTFTNVAVNTELVPNTGMIFPFISSGGSAMWALMAMVGMTLSVGMTKTKSIFED